MLRLVTLPEAAIPTTLLIMPQKSLNQLLLANTLALLAGIPMKCTRGRVSMTRAKKVDQPRMSQEFRD